MALLGYKQADATGETVGNTLVDPSQDVVRDVAYKEQLDLVHEYLPKLSRYQQAILVNGYELNGNDGKGLLTIQPENSRGVISS